LAAWRSWLAQNHTQSSQAWLVLYKSGALKMQLSFNEAQEEAVCYGWVDVKSQRIDDARYMVLFVPRKPASAWSASNIELVERMEGAGLMAEVGRRKVAEAKANGQWDLALRVERTEEIPPDLQAALLENGALDGYKGLSHSRKKQILRHILTVKSQDTRDRIIEDVVRESLDSV
jgi:uncharacterized protein YdeI (YjbR/CyaY-like superfamily)